MTLATNNITDELGTGSPDFPQGMPTVAGAPIVESGSNSDGYWARWADGTAAVRKQGLTLTYSTGNILKGTWNYPIPLPGLSVVSNATYVSSATGTPEFFGAQATPGSDQFGGIGVSRPANQSLFAAMLTKGTTPTFASGDTVSLDVNAIGRWK